MTQRRPSIGFLSRFGRSFDLRQFDEALRSLDLHPNLVPEPVKITAVNLLADQAAETDPGPQAYRAAAEIVAYCMIGLEPFAATNGELLALEIERRIDAALESGDNLDAQLILLMLHANVIQPEIVARFRLRAD